MPDNSALSAKNVKEMLRLHMLWLDGEGGGVRADFSSKMLPACADLRYADLSSADLSYADLRDANLCNANLCNADLSNANLSNANLCDGVRWEEYLSTLVPALLTAGGRPLHEVATPGVWGCHSWSNCPMAVAFGVEGTEKIPALYRWQAGRFIQFFDAGLIPLPTIPTTESVK